MIATARCLQVHPILKCYLVSVSNENHLLALNHNLQEGCTWGHLAVTIIIIVSIDGTI